MSFYSENWIKKTRKPHRCIWCGETIEAGGAALSASGIWEGDFWSGHFHPECAEAKDSVVATYGEWTGDESCARGRTDDDTTKPPEFSPAYRGSSNPTGLRSPRFGGDKQDPVVLPHDFENHSGRK